MALLLQIGGKCKKLKKEKRKKKRGMKGKLKQILSNPVKKNKLSPY